MRSKKGITLIALIITIIVLLILAGVSINLIVGENGILRQSSDAVNTYKQKENQESGEFDNLYNEFGNYINELTGKGDNDSDRVDSTGDLWDFDATTGTLRGYKGTPEQLFGDSDTVKIPSHIDGIEVKVIGGNGEIFYNCRGGIVNKKLILPSTVQVIDMNAFNSTDLDNPMFVGELVIPDSVTTIGSFAFYRCGGFTSLVLPESLSSIGIGAFRECTGLTGDLYIPASVTDLGAQAFDDCSGFNGKLTLLTASRNNAFRGTNFKQLELGIKDVSNENLPTFSSEGPGTTVNSLILRDTVESIGHCAFQGWKLSGELTIPSSVKTVGDYSFDGSSLNAVTILNASSIGDCAFYNCSELAEVTLPNSLKTIGKGAFANTKLTQVYIPDSVTLIDMGAFAGCSSLTSVSLPSSTTVAEGAFSGVNPIFHWRNNAN